MASTNAAIRNLVAIGAKADIAQSVENDTSRRLVSVNYRTAKDHSITRLSSTQDLIDTVGGACKQRRQFGP